jgi:hypothetical protein
MTGANKDQQVTSKCTPPDKKLTIEQLEKLQQRIRDGDLSTQRFHDAYYVTERIDVQQYLKYRV